MCATVLVSFMVQAVKMLVETWQIYNTVRLILCGFISPKKRIFCCLQMKLPLMLYNVKFIDDIKGIGHAKMPAVTDAITEVHIVRPILTWSKITSITKIEK